MLYFYNILSFYLLFLAKFLYTDQYISYLLHHNFRINNNFSHFQFFNRQRNKKYRGNNQKDGLVLTSCWLLWSRPNYLLNLSGFRNYCHITTVTIQCSLCNSLECGFCGNRLFISLLVYSCWFICMRKCLSSNLQQGRFSVIDSSIDSTKSRIVGNHLKAAFLIGCWPLWSRQN